MQQIRDKHGKVIAITETVGTKTTLRSTNGVTRGTYDTRDNITRRGNGLFHSYGNSLAWLAQENN